MARSMFWGVLRQLTWVSCFFLVISRSLMALYASVWDMQDSFAPVRRSVGSIAKSISSGSFFWRASVAILSAPIFFWWVEWPLVHSIFVRLLRLLHLAIVT